MASKKGSGAIDKVADREAKLLESSGPGRRDLGAY